MYAKGCVRRPDVARTGLGRHGGLGCHQSDTGLGFRSAESRYVQVASADKTRLCRNHVGWLGIAVVASLAGTRPGTKRVKAPCRHSKSNPLQLAPPDRSGATAMDGRLKEALHIHLVGSVWGPGQDEMAPHIAQRQGGHLPQSSLSSPRRTPGSHGTTKAGAASIWVLLIRGCHQELPMTVRVQTSQYMERHVRKETS